MSIRWRGWSIGCIRRYCGPCGIAPAQVGMCALSLASSLPVASTERLTLLGELLLSVEDEGCFTAAAPSQALSGRRVASAVDFEATGGAVGAPAEYQLVPADFVDYWLVLRRWRLCWRLRWLVGCWLRLLWRRRRGGLWRRCRSGGSCGFLVQGGDFLPGQSFSRLGAAQQRVSVVHLLLPNLLNSELSAVLRFVHCGCLSTGP